MGTLIRPEISKKNKYWIDKHRHYELKHFCLQYPMWKRMYDNVEHCGPAISVLERIGKSNTPSDPTAKQAMLNIYLKDKIDLIERIAYETDPYLYEYILRAVTEGLSYTYLKTKLDMPCGKDMYYDRYRKFFWLLGNSRK